MKIKRILKITLLILIAGAIAISELYAEHHIKPSDAWYYLTSYEDDLVHYEEEYGLVFRPYLDKTRISADFYQDKWESVLDVDPTVKEPLEVARFVRALKPELAKIPPAVLKNDLDTIFFLTNIFYKVAVYGGTYHAPDNAIFIRSRGEKLKYSTKFYKTTLHHEFSSILMKKYHFDKTKWRAAYPDKFVYGGEAEYLYLTLMLMGEIPKMTEEELYDRALLEQYGETSLENDFNNYAEAIFTDPELMKKLVAKYPIIKRKYEVFKEFYLSIDGGFQPVFDKIEG